MLDASNLIGQSWLRHASLLESGAGIFTVDELRRLLQMCCLVTAGFLACRAADGLWMYMAGTRLHFGSACALDPLLLAARACLSFLCWQADCKFRSLEGPRLVILHVLVSHLTRLRNKACVAGLVSPCSPDACPSV